jgi:hypothetical protein
MKRGAIYIDRSIAVAEVTFMAATRPRAMAKSGKPAVEIRV